MSLRFGVAIVLLVLLLVCIVLARIAYRRWKYPPKRRRRDSDPAHLQYHRQFMADLRRLKRGLRFPSVPQKERHMKWRQRFLSDPTKVFQEYVTKIGALKLAALENNARA